MENKRAIPVRMIWMFISLTLMIGLMMTVIFSSRRFDRIMQNILVNAVPVVLLAVGAGICLCRGSANLALPGIACLCGCLTALIGGENGDLTAVGIIVAIFTGAALGALTGTFAIQSRRNIWLVTGISSLLFGLLFFSLAGLFVYGASIRLRTDRDLPTVIGIIALVIGITVAILSGLGRHVSTNEGDDAKRPGGGIRLVWTLIAGALAGLAGAFMVIRVGAFQPTFFSNYNESYIIPALLFAGALIPNLRGTKGEGIWGGLAIIFGSVALATMLLLFSVWAVDTLTQRILVAVISILLLIPNILIGRGSKKQPQQYAQPMQYAEVPQYTGTDTARYPQPPQPPQYPQYPEYPQN